MNASEVTKVVRDADPAPLSPPVDPALRDALFARITASPPLARAGRRRRRVASAAVAVCALVASIGLLHGTRPPDLAERAYAATNPHNGIIHEVIETRSVVPSAVLGTRGSTERTELWVRPADGTWRAVSPEVENAVGADGALRSWNRAENRVHTMSAQELQGRLASGAPGFDRLGRDVVASFRAAYERESLRDAGVAKFAGQDVRRYRAVQSDAAGENTYEQTWYISIATTLPVGVTVRATSARHGSTVSTTTVQRHETLAPTAENLLNLRFGH